MEKRTIFKVQIISFESYGQSGITQSTRALLKVQTLTV